jgi:hypothetical protein
LFRSFESDFEGPLEIEAHGFRGGRGTDALAISATWLKLMSFKLSK